MNKIEIQIQYNGRKYIFDDGLKAYIFALTVGRHLCDEVLEQFVEKAYSVACMPNTTWTEDIVQHLYDNWERLKDWDDDDIYSDFVWNYEED